MALSPLSLIYGAGLAQAVFLMFALATVRVRHSRPRRLLIAIVFAFSLLLTEEFLDETGLPLNLGLGLAVEFALAPLIYLFARAMFRADPPTTKDLLHFAPLAAAGVALAVLHLNAPGRISVSNPDLGAAVAFIVMLKIAFFFAYIGAALRLALPDDVARPRLSALRGLRWVIALCGGAYALNAAAFLAFLARAPLIPDSDAVGAVIVAASVYALGYYGLVSGVLDVRDPYAARGLSPARARAMRARAANYLATTEAFRDPDLDLKTLARRLGVKPGELTQALNRDEAGGFNGLINSCRLRSYLEARADPANAARTTLELAFGAGFNSKATFYRVLKGAGRAPLAGMYAPPKAEPG